MKNQLIIGTIDAIPFKHTKGFTLYIDGVIASEKKFLFWKTTEYNQVLLTCNYFPWSGGEIYNVTDVDTGKFLGDKFKPTIKKFIDFDLKGKLT